MRWAFSTWTLCLALAAHGHPGYQHDVDRLTRALRNAPSATLYLQRAERLRLLHRHKDALEDLERAQHLGASADLLALGRGLTFADRGDLTAALGELDHYLRRGGSSAEALRVRARVLRELGAPDQAAQDLYTLLARGPDPDLCLSLARLEEASLQLAEATRVLEQCVTSLRGAAPVRLELIALLDRQQEHPRALAHARAGMQGLSVKAEWRLWAARSLDRLGDAKAARAEREAALAELDGALARRRGALHQLMRAKTLGELGRRPEALAQLDELLSRQPGFREALALRDLLTTDPRARP